MHKSSPCSLIPSPKNFLVAVARPEQQKVDEPQICVVRVQQDTAWKQELSTLQSELDTMGLMVGLEGKAAVGAQRDKQQHRDEAKVEIKADVLVQKTKEEIKAIRGQCDDLIKMVTQKKDLEIQRKLQSLDKG